MNAPLNKDLVEATAMWSELERRTKFDGMNELHQIQLDRIEDAHQEDMDAMRSEIIRRGIVNDHVTKTNSDLRRRLNHVSLILFACALLAAYLAVRG